jgi:hypothetical protein
MTAARVTPGAVRVGVGWSRSSAYSIEGTRDIAAPSRQAVDSGRRPLGSVRRSFFGKARDSPQVRLSPYSNHLMPGCPGRLRRYELDLWAFIEMGTPSLKKGVNSELA